MSKSIDTKEIEIFKMEHKEFLETKIAKLRDSIAEDNVSLEKEIIKIFIDSLLAHGKEKRQIRQIARISRILGESLGLGAAYCDKLEQAAQIYDIGNVTISKEIYEKDEKLSFEEFKVVKNHTLIGHYLLKTQGFPVTDLAAIISLEHHEWWNGGGYPAQREAHDINIASRIVAVADTVSALFRNRSDRMAWEYKKIVEYIETRSGIQFDPEVVEKFLINQEKIDEILHEDI